MATDRNVYELIDEYTYLGQEMKNVYFYQSAPALSLTADNVVTDWIANVLPTIIIAQPSAVVHSRVAARNLFNPAETAEELISTAGTLSGGGDLLPPMLAAGFTLERQDGSTRNGKKRIMVGTEAYQNNGSWLAGAFVTLLNNIALKLESPLVFGAITDFFPVIVKRILDGDSYRLPETLAEAVVNGVADAIASVVVTTQNSRKIGVGE